MLDKPAHRIVVIGPSGSGKSVVGTALAARLRVPFEDADDLHPRENVERMARGIALTDDDRMPWLDVVGEHLASSAHLVMACSALARRYRARILIHAPDAIFVELRASESELARRMSEREHFMPPALLASQLAAWEPLGIDERGFAVSNTTSPPLVADSILALLDEGLPS